MSDTNIAVLGTGMMGPGIAVGMPQAGHMVALYGRSPASLERGFATVSDMFGLLSVGDVISARKAEQVRSRIRGTTDLRDATAPAAVVGSYLFADLAADRTTGPVVRERVANGNLGVKSGRRFFEWTDERARAARAVRDQFLLARLKERRAARSAQGADAQAESEGGA